MADQNRRIFYLLADHAGGLFDLKHHFGGIGAKNIQPLSDQGQIKKAAVRLPLIHFAEAVQNALQFVQIGGFISTAEDLVFFFIV